jgi:hypothetical protein
MWWMHWAERAYLSFSTTTLGMMVALNMGEIRDDKTLTRRAALPPPSHSDANWCCSDTDENGLWFNRRYSEEMYMAHWETMVARHRDRPNVIAAELRNELRYSCGIDDDNGEPVCVYVPERTDRRTRLRGH